MRRFRGLSRCTGRRRHAANFGGPGTTFDSTPDLTITGSPRSSAFGGAIDGNGDFNGDGFVDMLVGRPGAQVFLGGTEPDGLADWTADGSGYNLAFGGDVNADGFTDILLGNGSSFQSAVYLGSAALDSSPDVLLAGADVLSDGGDINGDGYDDMVLAIPLFEDEDGNQTPPTTHVYVGGATIGTSPAATFPGIGSNAAATDTNGDGFSDVFISYWENRGSVSGYFGRAGAGVDATRDVLVSGSQSRGDQALYVVD